VATLSLKADLLQKLLLIKIKTKTAMQGFYLNNLSVKILFSIVLASYSYICILQPLLMVIDLT